MEGMEGNWFLNFVVCLYTLRGTRPRRTYRRQARMQAGSLRMIDLTCPTYLLDLASFTISDVLLSGQSHRTVGLLNMGVVLDANRNI